jgi:choloylglycine hydrolase
MKYFAALIALASVISGYGQAWACTGISLKSNDGAVIAARTVEWALGDANHDTLIIFPRNQSFKALTPDGENGLSWTGKHGFVSLTAYGQDYGPDALNEKGLYVGVYYFPGHASFSPYDKKLASTSLSVGDFMRWMLSSFSSVAEVRANLDKVRVVNVEDPRFGGAPLPFHWKIADSSGDAIIIEIVNDGEVKVFDALLGVVTNAPEYSWHLTNLRNYLGLTSAPKGAITIDGQVFAPFGGGSGLIGLPGDFTPPSRFVRALALTASARPLETAHDAVFEAFRILDNFNIPIGVTASQEKIAHDIASATQVTTASDLKNRVLYFHTMDNRQIQKFDLKKINFETVQKQQITQGAIRQQVVNEIVLTQ